MQRQRLLRLVLLAALLAAAYSLAHGLLLAPDETTRLRDDAYYEFVWARNLAAGHGGVVSDGVTTSGIQWLWSLLLAFVAWCGGGARLPAVAAGLGVALHCAGALSWVVAGRGRVEAWILGLLWLGNPLLVRECENGQETALACLVLALFWHARRARWPAFTLLACLAVGARTALLGVVVAMSAWRAWAGEPAAGGDRGARRLAPGFLLVPLLPFGMLVLADYRFGHGPWPDSGAPMTWLAHASFLLTEPTLGETLHRYWWYMRPMLLGGPWELVSAPGLGAAVFLLVRAWWPRRLRWLPALCVAAVAVHGSGNLLTAGFVALLLGFLPRGRRLPLAAAGRGEHGALAALTAGLTALLALHYVVRWYPRDYYFAPLLVLAMAALWRLRRVALLLLAAALTQAVQVHWLEPEPLRGQETMAMAGRFLVDVLPPQEPVGCFNSGLVTFYAGAGTPPRPVYNLDGVVDWRALFAQQEHRLAKWLDGEHVRFLLDNPLQFATRPGVLHACGPWFGDGFDAAHDLVEVARFVQADVPGSGFRLYWRRGRGLPPQRPAQARELARTMDHRRYLLWPATAGAILEAELADGGRRELVHVDVDTACVLAVPDARLGTGRLFVRGEAGPVLVCAGL
jgi:hypothetical protein